MNSVCTKTVPFPLTEDIELFRSNIRPRIDYNGIPSLKLLCFKVLGEDLFNKSSIDHLNLPRSLRDQFHIAYPYIYDAGPLTTTNPFAQQEFLAEYHTWQYEMHTIPRSWINSLVMHVPFMYLNIEFDNLNKGAHVMRRTFIVYAITGYTTIKHPIAALEDVIVNNQVELRYPVCESCMINTVGREKYHVENCYREYEHNRYVHRMDFEWALLKLENWCAMCKQRPLLTVMNEETCKRLHGSHIHHCQCTDPDVYCRRCVFGFKHETTFRKPWYVMFFFISFQVNARWK